MLIGKWQTVLHRYSLMSKLLVLDMTDVVPSVYNTKG